MAEKKHMTDSKFECPACGEAGVITLPDEFTRFDCPADCGASFVKFQGLGAWHIKCVVQPVFATDKDAH